MTLRLPISDEARISPVSLLDKKAGAFLNPKDPTELPSPSTRLAANTPKPTEFETDYFKGRMVLIHRPPHPSQHFHYQSYFGDKKRRWELRWQGVFKVKPKTPVVFGTEVSGDSLPHFGFATRALLSLVVGFARHLARARGSDLISNAASDVNDERGNRFFVFPLNAADKIVTTRQGDEPPDISTVGPIEGTTLPPSGESLSLLNDIDTTVTYTFVFYSMYVDLVSWDLRHVPTLSGTSLTRIVGNQPLRVIMRDCEGNYHFQLVVGNRNTSIKWASMLQNTSPPCGTGGSHDEYTSVGAEDGEDNESSYSSTPSSEYYSVVSTIRNGTTGAVAWPPQRKAGKMTRARRSLWRSIKRVLRSPIYIISPCWNCVNGNMFSRSRIPRRQHKNPPPSNSFPSHALPPSSPPSSAPSAPSGPPEPAVATIPSNTSNKSPSLMSTT